MSATPTSRPWSPSDRDRMIYKWAKFDGHKQSWIADQLELSQSTVSRIIDRYERWVAHGGPAQQGALSRDERLRAQVWLTYERNEWVIASALRLAGEMESLSDTSKSTTTHHCSDPTREIEVRTENSIRDRTGLAHRYLNLVNRVGQQQVQLIEKYDLPALEPFTLDEHEYAQTLEDAKPKSVNVFPASAGEREASAARYVDNTDHDRVSPNADTLTRSVSEDESLANSIQPAPEGLQIPNPQSELCTSVSSSSFSLHTSSFSPAPMHTTHNPDGSESSLTSTPIATSIEIAPHKKPIAHAYALPQTPPKPTDQLEPILNATIHDPPPPIRILPLHLPLGS